MDFLLRHWFDILLTVGIMIGGETIMIPAVYFSFVGYIPLWKLVVISVLANLIADSFWYSVGRFFSFDKLKNMSWFSQYAEKIEEVGSSIKKHGLKFLFVSKFVIGTRTIMQILCGMNKIKLTKYLVVNTAGIIAYLFTFYGIAYIFRASLDQLNFSEVISEVSFGVIFILMLILSIYLGKKAQEKWFQL